jgi:hypothetical protein
MVPAAQDLKILAVSGANSIVTQVKGAGRESRSPFFMASIKEPSKNKLNISVGWAVPTKKLTVGTAHPCMRFVQAGGHSPPYRNAICASYYCTGTKTAQLNQKMTS